MELLKVPGLDGTIKYVVRDATARHLGVNNRKHFRAGVPFSVVSLMLFGNSVITPNTALFM